MVAATTSTLDLSTLFETSTAHRPSYPLELTFYVLMTRADKNEPVRNPCGPRHSIDLTSVDERRIVLLPHGRSHRLRRPVPSTPCGTPRGPRKDGRELMELMEGAQTPLYYDHHKPRIRRGLCFIRRGSWGRETPLPLLFKPSVLGWRGECSRGAGVEPSTWSPPRFPRF
jgi:hypothetical protein